MKKTLRNLMLAGAAALLATGASAQTLEKVWEKNSGVPGAAAGGDMRFMSCDKDGKIIVTDKAAKKIKTFLLQNITFNSKRIINHQITLIKLFTIF